MQEAGGTKSLCVRGLRAGWDSTEVLCDVSVSLRQGELACLCGPNGAGKSTLLSVLAGVPDARLFVAAEEAPAIIGAAGSTALAGLSRRERARLIASMQQNEYSEWDFSVRDFVLQGRYARSHGGHYMEEDYAAADAVLAELGLGAFADRGVHSLSGGEFQKVRIARSLAQSPAFMLLDEPAANLDYVFGIQLMQLLRGIARGKGIGILASVHDINMAARFADRIILLPPRHAALCGSPAAVLTEENLRLAFGVPFRRVTESVLRPAP